MTFRAPIALKEQQLSPGEDISQLRLEPEQRGREDWHVQGNSARSDHIPERATMNRPILRLKNIDQYLGKRHVISDLSITVPRGQVYGFLGRNGAGKTTVMKIILGLITPASGTVEVDGTAVGPTDTRYLSRIGSLIEEPSFYPNLTGAENIRYLSRVRGTKPADRELLGLVGLSAHADRRAGQYSLGMKQRLGIALALVGDPDILPLDEPTNGLDPEGIREIRELIQRFSREMGKTIVVSSHILSEIEQLADLVGIIHHGSLHYEGSLEGLVGTRSLVIDPVYPDAAARSLNQHAVPFEMGRDAKLRLAPRDREATASLVDALVADGVGVAGVKVDQCTLEEAFLAVTGEATTDDLIGARG